MVIGVFTEDLVDIMGDALMEVGNIDHGVVIYGCGLDEISPLGPSTILEIRNTAAPGEPKVFETKKFGYDPRGGERAAVRGGGPERRRREGERGPHARGPEGGGHTNAKRDAIVLNAGVGIYVFGLADSINAGIAVARETLESGKGLEKLDEWVGLTQKLAAA